MIIDVDDFDLTKITGAGNVTLDADATISGSKSTAATGKLTINEGKTLTIGGGDSETNSIVSFTSIDLAGMIKHRNSKATLNNVTIPTGKTGKIFAYDMGDDADGFKLAGTTTLNGNLTVCSKWNFQMKVDELAGSGTWLICGTTSGDFDDAGTESDQAATVNVASASSYTGNVTVNNSNATVNLSGNLVGSSWTKTNGTLKYKGKTDAEPTLNGTTLSGVILDGSQRLKIIGAGVTIENLVGNNQSTGTNTYAFYTAGTGTVTLKGTCDFTKKSDNSNASATYIGVSNNDALVIADNANIKVKCLYNSKTKANNANWTIGSDATLEVTSTSYTPSVTNNGILTLGDVLTTDNVTLGEGSQINTGSNITGTITVSGDATLRPTSASLNLTSNISVASGKTLTVDGDNNPVALTLTGSITGDVNLENTILEGGSTRDFSTLPYADYDNCTLIVTETTAEFNTDDEFINITNIPSYFTTIKLRRADRRYVILDVTDGSATFTDSEAKVSGPKCLYDFTFSQETLAERKAENSSTILNSGSRGSSNGLTYDTGYNSNNSYNNETGLLKVKSTPWRDMTGSNAWPDNYSVAVYANVPDVENGCLMAFGSSTNGGNKYLALIRGANQNEIKLVKGDGINNHYVEIATMSAENATVAKHLVVFTKSGSTFKVYCDGVNVASTTYNETLGTGFQIGSVHGGVSDNSGSTGIIRINDGDNVSSEVRDAVEIQSIRIFDGVLDDDQMSALMAEFPYVSKGGSYIRTISADANLGEDDAWTKDDETTHHIPTSVVEETSTYYPDVTVTTNADATLTVNEDVTFGKTSFGGSGTLTIEADGSGHSINVGGAVIVNSDVVVKFGAIDMSTSPVTKGAAANLTFDFSDFNFNKVYATTTYTLTGVISQDDTHITATGLPSSDGNRSYAFAFDDNHYKLTVTVRPSQTVYLPSGITEIEDDMAVKLTADAGTNNGVLIRGDELVISETGTITCSQSSGFCSLSIPEGVTLTVSNSDALKASAISDDGTLNISMTDSEITTALDGTASCTLIDVSSAGQIAVGALTINGGEKYAMGDYNYYISQDETSNDVVLVKHYERSVTSGRFGSICIENGAFVSDLTNTGIEKVLKVTEVTNDRVVMDEVEDEMAAGVPYIFKSNASTINLTLQGETAEEPDNTTQSYLVGNFAVANVPNSDEDNTYYILQSNQFKKVTTSTIKSGKNRCYLKVTGASSRQATLGIAVDEDAPTGIDAINALMNNNAEIYDINGRKLSDLRKGINIVNGVKVIVK
ncbi:MAG: hypothetical protein J5630_00135 [Bacteroidaceae bacterium]|nr:hypothetical protein [Bacteroidaceae bacterium]